MDKRIRIFFVHRTLRQSGAARQISLIYRLLDRAVFAPSFIVQTDRRVFFSNTPESEPLTVLSRSELRPFAAIREFSSIIQREKPAIIQSFNTDGNLLTYLATRRAPVPVFIASMRNTNKSWPEIQIERKISSAYNSLVVNSVATRDELLKRAAIPEQRINVIPNGVDTDSFRPLPDGTVGQLRHEHNIPGNAFVAVSVGRITRQKNHACTLQALALFRQRTRYRVPFIWYCVGLQENRQLYRQLWQQAAGLDLQAECRFVESVMDMPALYAIADISILSSDWEGMPNAMLESMACGRIVAVADTADNDAIVDHGNNGFRFPRNNPAALARILESVLAMTDEQRRLIGRKARARIVEHYNMQGMASRYQQLYHQFVDSNMKP